MSEPREGGRYCGAIRYRITGEPDHSVRKRPRPDKKDMFGTYGRY